MRVVEIMHMDVNWALTFGSLLDKSFSTVLLRICSSPLFWLVICSQRDILGDVGVDVAWVLRLTFDEGQECNFAAPNYTPEWKWFVKILQQKRLRSSSKFVQVEWTYPMTNFQIRVGKCHCMQLATRCLSLWSGRARNNVIVRSFFLNGLWSSQWLMSLHALLCIDENFMHKFVDHSKLIQGI